MDVMNVKSFGAIGDGEKDDTPAIQRAADAIPTEGGILYFPQGVYRIVFRARQPAREPAPVGIELKSRTWALGTGPGSIIKADGKGVICVVQGASQVRISNLVF